MTALERESDRPHRREPATAVFARRVKPGREARYEKLARDMVETWMALPGHLAATVLHEKDSPDYTLLYGFTDRPALQACLVRTDHGCRVDELQPFAALRMLFSDSTGAACV